MAAIQDLMERHHKHCDELFAVAEDAVQRADRSLAVDAFRRFALELDAHFSAEESVLFPGFERVTGIAGGPTQVMRMEHRQMRGLLQQMEQAVAAGDGRAFSGAAETLLILMQQHNLKEENILYPMCDRSLGGDEILLGDLAQALQAVQAPQA
jgi:hemerythrin-like domain-containing protein